MKHEWKTMKDMELYRIENEMIESVEVKCIGHFDNVVSLEIFCKNTVPYSARNNTQNIGYVIQNLVELLDLGDDDGITLSDVKNIPIRIAYHKAYGTVAIGHFMKDRFITIDDLAASYPDKEEDS